MTDSINNRDNASHKAFEKWVTNLPAPWRLHNIKHDEDGYYYSAEAEKCWKAWQACDAAWRERLQSKEMVEKCAKNVQNSDATFTLLDSKEGRAIARTIIAAILGVS